MKEEGVSYIRVIEWTVLLVLTVLGLNWGTEKFFGSPLLDFAIGIFFLLVVAAIGAYFLKLTVAAIGFLFARRWQTRQVFVISFVAFFSLIYIPHIFMEYKLAPLKKEFVGICEEGKFNRSIVPVGVNQTITVADFDGRLDDIIARRTAILKRYHYLPGYTGGWWFSESFFRSRVIMVYFFTYTPKKLYDRLFPKPIQTTGPPPVGGAVNKI